MKEGEEKPSKVDFFTSNNCVWDYMSSCHLGGSALEQVWRTMYSSWNNRNSCYWHEVVGFLLSFYGNRNSERFRLDLPKVVAVSLSPLNNWLVTITPFKQEPNLQIWDMKTGELHYALIQKSFSRSVWLVCFSLFLVVALSAVGFGWRMCLVP